MQKWINCHWDGQISSDCVIELADHAVTFVLKMMHCPSYFRINFFMAMAALFTLPIGDAFPRAVVKNDFIVEFYDVMHMLNMMDLLHKKNMDFK